jgi:threonine/homoserine/homoserine lactone efflux protein
VNLDASFIAWLALAALVTIAPGPDTLLVLGHAMKSGVRAGLAVTAGTISGFFWYAGLAGFGFMSILAATPALYLAVKTAGALYLAWIGAGMLLGAFRPKPEHAAPPKLGAPFRQGLFTNAFNPKIALFYLAALPQFVPAGPDAPGHAILLIGVHYAMGAAWLSGLVFAAARAGEAIRASPVTRWIEGAIGALLIGLGMRLIFDRRA